MTDLETGRPTIPVLDSAQEADDLYISCLDDQDILVRAGLDWKIVEDLPIRTLALRVSQSKWIAVYKKYQDCQEEWKVEAPEAAKLRDELVHHFFHAFNKNKGLYGTVRLIAESKSNSGTIQNLLNLYELGIQNPKELEAIGFDMKTLDVAKEKSFMLGLLLARTKKALRDTKPALQIRNKAYNHLKAAVDEVRRMGQYAFWHDELKIVGYASTYLRKANSKKKGKEEKETPA
jgi:hypothetical protein